jgi:tetratricopeptide (TPR) repeat protein
MALLQSALIGLLALIITPGLLFYFDVTPKIVVLLFGAGITLLGCAWTGTISRKAAIPEQRWFGILLVFNLLSLGFSTALSQSPALSLFGTNWRRLGLVTHAAVMLFAWLVASHAAGDRSRIRTILRGIVIAGGLSAVYGICQYFGWDPILPSGGYHIGEGFWTIVRPPGTLGYVSYFATWLVFAALLSMASASMESGGLWRRAAYAVTALCALATIFTGTRAAMLGLVLGFAAKLFFMRYRAATAREWFSPNAFARPLAIAVLVLVAGAAFYFSPAGQNLRTRARWFSEDPWGGARLNLWQDSVRMAVPKLAQGYGPEVFTAAFPAYKSKALARAYPDFLHESPHNMFLDALVAQGLAGLLILAGLCVLGLRLTRDTTSAWIGAALAAGIVSQQFTVFTMPTAFLFYVTIALGVAYVSRATETKRDVRLLAVAVPVAAALFLLAARFAIADHELALAQHYVEAGDLNAAVMHYNGYERWKTPGTSADLWYSRALLGLAQKSSDPGARFQVIAQSGAAAVRATRLAEDPFNAWYNMAVLYATQNDSQRTESSLRAAIAANPYWFKPHWTLAQLLRLERRRDEAQQEAAIAADLNHGKDPEVSQTLRDIETERAAN